MTERSARGNEVSLFEVCRALEQGVTSSRRLVDQSLDRIADPAGEGSRSFISVAADRARAEATQADDDRAAGRTVPPFSGIPIAVKDLFDLEGEVTTAGSKVLSNEPPADADAPCVARLRQAGMIVVGRTNMTEFAYSGLGLNPHYGTPKSVWNRHEAHIPGGSSSGSAVSVADRQAFAALGTDTGGSCRIPAAFSNIVGYKPTARLIPLDGVVPLSPSLDSVGPLAESTTTCRVVHELMTGRSPDLVRTALVAEDVAAPQLTGHRLSLLNTLVLDGLDSDVQERFERALHKLSAAGIEIVEQGVPELHDLASINSSGGLAAGEAYRWHEGLLQVSGSGYDPRVRTRIEPGEAVTDSDLMTIRKYRQRLVQSFVRRSEGFDAWVLPTVAMLPPRIADFPAFDGGADTFYRQANMLALRNTSVGNMLDSCSISLPLCQPDERADAPPVGLMLMAPAMTDDHLLALAEMLEPVCRSV